jgi:hypothetical protein
MGMRKKTAGICAAVLAVAFASLGFAAAASAHTGEWAKFNYCPSTNPGVNKCLYSLTTSGKVVLGKKTVPIVHPVTLQGGVSKPVINEVTEEQVSTFYGATNGETLSKTPQPVPGGLTGLVNCKEISISWVRSSCEAVLENGVTGVNATLELAKPASEIRVSEINLLNSEGTALLLPVKVHLENPFLGSSCYVGSSSAPLLWNLTTGTTSPPAGVAPITGNAGTAKGTESNQILNLLGTELVDNTWSAPGASGCGGFLIEYLINPIINLQVGLPSAAGKNQAVLLTENALARAVAVNEH